MNPFARFFDLIGNPSHSRTLGILAVLVIALAIPLTVQIAQKQQELRQQAAETCSEISLGTYCNPIVGIPDSRCEPTTDPTAGCPSGTQKYKCYQKKCTAQPPASTSPSTPPASTAPAPFSCDPYPGCCGTIPLNLCSAKSVAPPTQAPSQTSCPGSGDALYPNKPGDSFGWGGNCTSGSKKYVVAPATNNRCYYQSCEQYNNGPLCWFNSGIGNAGACPDSCSPNGGTCEFSTLPACESSRGAGKCATRTDLTCSNGNTCMIASPAAPVITCDASKGFVSVCTTADQAKGRILNGPCSRVCPAGTTKAGQTVDGVSYKECQSNLCWYDSLYDTTPAKVEEGKQAQYGPGWCYADPSKTDPCTTTATPPSIQSVVVLSNLTLHGLGTAGDIKNPSQRPTTPQGGKRKAVVDLINIATGTTIQSTQVTPQLNSNGTFTVSSSFNNIPTANYTVKIKVDGFLKKSYGAVTVNNGQNVTLANPLTLVAADLVVDSGNRVDTLDYNTLSSCFGQSGSGSCSLSDLDDSGTVDLFDFNLLLREFGQVGD